ncbi:glycosyltransferase 6-like [Magnolia sinica]|uniref:glycosyltransferase 6-like n=1 Tax=Magnolia sinica TaxID=86752 RepID=UPI0026581827|nr:glycosyltransferase 6-like [Magnolia sinica]
MEAAAAVETPKSPMAKTSTVRAPKTSFLSDFFLFSGGAMVALLLVWTLWSLVSPSTRPTFATPQPKSDHSQTPLLTSAPRAQTLNIHPDPSTPNFYDDPNLSYTIEKPLKGWDEKRRDWLRQHPELAAGSHDRVVLVTGSQPGPCQNPIGDHLLLRFFKNKVDYCRIHGCDLFYNNALFHPKMTTFWAKIPLVRSAMVAHPEAEWIWWVDSDAAFTDMEFRLPLAKYKDHNLIVHGWPDMVYEKKSWVSLNAGIFLIRNCQWSLDFMDVWASMGPQTPEYEKWGRTQKALFKDKLFPESDDQTGLVYLLVMEKDKWADRIYLESEYYFEGYWVEIVGILGNVTEKYLEMERGVRRLRRRHAEKMGAYYGKVREEYLKGWGSGKGSLRRPFVTHFTGCQPCSGDHNEMYSGESCWDGMRRVLNFADNQVLRRFGFARRDLLDDDHIDPLPFDYPA